MPLLYLDNCALQRPLDDRSQFRVRSEADAITATLDAIEAGDADLTTSTALRVEVGRIQNRTRRDFISNALALASRNVRATPEVRALARSYRQAGMKPLDALHLASAVEGGADYFCTTDDRLLKKARAANTQGTRVVDPFELASALSL
ncbi:MAG: PIN domain-containing protein [Bacteroidota bacterium]